MTDEERLKIQKQIVRDLAMLTNDFHLDLARASTGFTRTQKQFCEAQTKLRNMLSKMKEKPSNDKWFDLVVEYLWLTYGTKNKDWEAGDLSTMYAINSLLADIGETGFTNVSGYRPIQDWMRVNLDSHVLERNGQAYYIARIHLDDGEEYYRFVEV
jgi:hypothetical protein